MATEITPHGRELIGEMLTVVNHDQYAPYLEDEATKRSVGSLIVAFAQRGKALSPVGIDYSVEAFGRHELSTEEFGALTTGLIELEPEEAEDELRVLHVALEVERAVMRELEATDIARKAEERVAITESIVDLVRRVENFTGAQMDAEELLQFADDYRSHVLFQDKEAGRESAVSVTGTIDTLQHAEDSEVQDFLRANNHITGLK